MGVDYGFFIREQAIKNLLSAQRKMAAKGNAKGLIAVTKFILSISHQFDGEMLKISQGINIDGNCMCMRWTQRRSLSLPPEDSTKN